MQIFKKFLKSILKRKKIVFTIGFVVLIILFFIFKPTDYSKNTTTEIAKYENLKQTVLATGQVVSSLDVDLSFNASGIVKDIKIKVGDNVKKGDVLMTLDQSKERANLTSAQGALSAAKARYTKINEGASNEQIAVSRIALENAKTEYENIKRTQATLVKNAYNNMLNSMPEARPLKGEKDYQAPIISGNYILEKEGVLNLKLYYSSAGISYDVSGLASGSGVNNLITAQPIGDSGLFIRFPDDDGISVSDWVIEIPNKKASNYLSNYNIYQAALKTEQSALSTAMSIVNQRQAELDLITSSARESDLELARADILSAQGSYEQALSFYNDKMIIAPFDGTITSIDIKTGELASAFQRVIVLQDVENMYLEANINEANVSMLKIGMPVDVNFDALGTENNYIGEIISIDPSSTLIGGVVNYKVKASVGSVVGLRPGMTANMTIKIKEKDSVIMVPSRSILVDDNGSKTIRKVINKKTKKWIEVPVETGIEADAGMIEVLNGVSEGDEYIVLIKN